VSVVTLSGRARRLGDNINTDYIVSSRRKRETIEEAALTRYLLEGVDPAFAASVQPGDVLVAGRNFGCGSAMEIAVTVILAAGIRAVVAQSFSRTFFRNAVNNGLLAVSCDTAGISEGDRLVIAAGDDAVRVSNETRGTVIEGAPLPPALRGIVSAGGLAPYVRRFGRLGVGGKEGTA